MNKICSTCGDDKDISEFYKKCTGKFGVQSLCKICSNEKHKIYVEANKDKLREKRKERYEENSEEIKNKTREYRKNNLEHVRSLESKYYYDNIEKRKKSASKTRLKNKEKIAAYNKKYREDNIDVITLYNKKYRQDNKEKLNKSNNDRNKEKYHKDPVFKFKKNLKRTIQLILKKKGFTKKSSTTEILGCSLDFFKEYIESRFTEGMSWFNRSEWHLDHIKPLKLAKTEEDVIKLCHYTNHQPLWAIDNLRKSSKFEESVQLKLI